MRFPSGSDELSALRSLYLKQRTHTHTHACFASSFLAHGSERDRTTSTARVAARGGPRLRSRKFGNRRFGVFGERKKLTPCDFRSTVFRVTFFFSLESDFASISLGLTGYRILNFSLDVDGTPAVLCKYRRFAKSRKEVRDAI